MYDIKFPQAVRTEYIKQCINCPYMELWASTETVHADNGNNINSHTLRCMNFDACVRLLQETGYEPDDDETIDEEIERAWKYAKDN